MESPSRRRCSLNASATSVGCGRSGRCERTKPAHAPDDGPFRDQALPADFPPFLGGQRKDGVRLLLVHGRRQPDDAGGLSRVGIHGRNPWRGGAAGDGNPGTRPGPEPGNRATLPVTRR